MQCPTLAELPSFSDGRGWPWTEEGLHLNELIPPRTIWPRITVVTPSYNQGQFLEETIRSVLLQGYPDIEYIIVDGGSTDQSVDIIRKYEKWLSNWVSENDRGQAHAVNKGWDWSTGSVLCWLNSDDTFAPGALTRVARAFVVNPGAVMAYGDCHVIDENSRRIVTKRMCSYNVDQLLQGTQMGQPSVFLSKASLEIVGHLDTTLHYALDFDLFLRVWSNFPPATFIYVPRPLANSREYPSTKSSTGVQNVTRERRKVLNRVYGTLDTKPELDRLKSVAYSSTYWRQADLELSAGQPVRALLSLAQSLLISPSAHSPRDVAKLILRILIPRPVWAIAKKTLQGEVRD